MFVILEIPTIDPVLSQGSCVGHDRMDWWTSERVVDQDRARQVCNDCPVRLACLDRAIVGQEFGIWGGLSEAERVALGAIPRRRMG